MQSHLSFLRRVIDRTRPSPVVRALGISAPARPLRLRRGVFHSRPNLARWAWTRVRRDRTLAAYPDLNRETSRADIAAAKLPARLAIPAELITASTFVRAALTRPRSVVGAKSRASRPASRLRTFPPRWRTYTAKRAEHSVSTPTRPRLWRLERS